MTDFKAGMFTWTPAVTVIDALIDSIAVQCCLIIEFIKTVASDENRLNLDNIGQGPGSGRTRIFRITAYGIGGTATARVMIQTTYGRRF
ncbi:MAG: hypothetical protein U5O39_04255 [Gammaproteobacteria bacterium]|nr:hypothetical protein [Gammaproteobacteria bacterium]